MIRPVATRRTWLFVSGADVAALDAAASAGADVVIQDLEDFTPPQLKEQARVLTKVALGSWRQAGCVPAVRINPLEHCGHDDLDAALRSNAHAILLAKAASPEQVVQLDRQITRHERDLGIPLGTTEIVPNIETAAALTRVVAMADASPRVTAMLLASEDMAADLGVARTATGDELAYARSRFIVECTAARVLAIDCPFTFADPLAAASDLAFAVGRGYKAKALVDPAQVTAINDGLTPSREAVARARRVVSAFEQARREGPAQARLDGHFIEAPTYHAARRLLVRSASFDALKA